MLSLWRWGLALLIWSFFSHQLDTLPIERRIDYTGHKVLRIHPVNKAQLELVDTIEESPWWEIDFWSEPQANSSIDLHVPPHSLQEVTSLLHHHGILYDIAVNDLQELISSESAESDGEPLGHRKRDRRAAVWLPSNYRRNLYRKQSAEIGEHLFYLFSIVGEFARHDQINTWLDFARLAKPEVVRVIEIGRSYENRAIRVIKIGKPAVGREKPAIWIDAGIHAREWIAPATATYIIHMLIDGYGQNVNVTHLVDTYDWYILPVVNPDGYEYSHTVDRLWRKTRSRTPSPQSRCRGVDANRNFEYQWLGHCSSNLFARCGSFNPCQGTYAGEHPFSEPETRAMRDFILRRRDQWKLYLTLHSYSQLWLTPWGYTDEIPQDYFSVMRLALKAIGALKDTHGTTFIAGSPALILYPAGGGSYDWAKATAGIKYSYTVELRDRGQFGFILPKQQIVPTGEEMWAAIQAVATEIEKEF